MPFDDGNDGWRGQAILMIIYIVVVVVGVVAGESKTIVRQVEYDLFLVRRCIYNKSIR